MSNIPKILKLGLIPAETLYAAVFEVITDGDSEITNTQDIKFSQSSLTAGKNTVTATIAPLREGTILYTDFKIADEKVIITAEASISGYNEQDRLVYSTDGGDSETPERLYLPKYPGSPQKQTAETILTRGSHINLRGDDFEAVISFDTDGYSHDIDAYVFLHDGGGTVKSPADLIFFGNDTAQNGSVSYLNAPDKRAVYVDFAKLPADIRQLDFVFAFYGSGGEMFSKLKSCGVKINCGGDRMYIPLSENAAVIVAFEITRTGDSFVLSPLVMPYKKGIETLCRNYGLKVN
jgi:stress response protein SCP2